MSELIYIQFLINELSRKQISITKEIYDEIKQFVASPEGQKKFELFKKTRLPENISSKKYQGFHSNLRNLSDHIPKELIKDD